MKARYSKEAVAYLARMPANRRIRIIEKIDQLVENPSVVSNNVTPLKGQPGMSRLRVGDYRVIFHMQGDSLIVDTVAPRSRAYR